MARCQLVVVEGRVGCPSNGNIPVEVCEACPHLRAFYDDDEGTTMVCKPPRGISVVALAALAWPFTPEESLYQH